MTFQRRWRNRAFTLLAAVVLCLSQAGLAWSQDVPGSNVNVLVAWDASDHYITPRGLNVEDEGLVLQPLMLMLWKLAGPIRGPCPTSRSRPASGTVFTRIAPGPTVALE